MLHLVTSFAVESSGTYVLWHLDYHILSDSAAYQIQTKNIMYIKYVCPFLYGLLELESCNGSSLC